MQKTNWLTEKIKSCMKYLIKKIGYEGFYFLSGVLMGIISSILKTIIILSKLNFFFL